MHSHPLHAVISLRNLLVSRVVRSLLRHHHQRLLLTHPHHAHLILKCLRHLRRNEYRLQTVSLRSLHQVRNAAVYRLRLTRYCLPIILPQRNSRSPSPAPNSTAGCSSATIHFLLTPQYSRHRIPSHHRSKPYVSAPFRTHHYPATAKTSASTPLPHSTSNTAGAATVGVKGLACDVRLFFTDCGMNGAASFTFYNSPVSRIRPQLTKSRSPLPPAEVILRRALCCC